MEFGNGSSVNYKYDAGGRIIEISHEVSNDLLRLQHLYDGAGNLRVRNEILPAASKAESYKYNSVYWLTKIDTAMANPFNANEFEPPSTALPPNMFNVQDRLDTLIGSLD